MKHYPSPFFFTLLGVLFLSSCSSFQPVHSPACKLFTDLPGPSSFITDDRGLLDRIVVISQNRLVRDETGEWIKSGSIAFFPLFGGNIRAPVTYRLSNRDSFPFHPVQGTTIEKNGKIYYYLINRPIRSQFVVEIYQVNGIELLFKKRIRSPLLQNPVRIRTLQNNDLLVLNRLESSFSGIERLFYSDALPHLLRIQNDEIKIEMTGLTELDDFTLLPEDTIRFHSIQQERSLTYHGKSNYGLQNVEREAGLEDESYGLGLHSNPLTSFIRSYDPKDLEEGNSGNTVKIKMDLTSVAHGTNPGETVLYKDDGSLLNGPGDLYTKEKFLLMGQYFGDGLLYCDLE